MSDTPRRRSARKVLRELSNKKAQPISPTANLRLLTSLASNLKNAPGQNSSQGDEASSASGSRGLKLIGRKQKSLGLLCKKFLSLYPLDADDSVPEEVSLDSTARILGTEKRRIYDIINILESLEMATKAGKNRYLWHGQCGLTETLEKMKLIALRLGLREQIQEIQRNCKAYIGDYVKEEMTCLEDLTELLEDVPEEEIYGDSILKEDKSLGAMSRKFMMLFLVSVKNGIINLDMAAKVLIIEMDRQRSEIPDVTSRSQFKTQVRRLYDIANVFIAIGLIKKINMYDKTMKKPVFKYIGPDVDSMDSEAESPIREKQKLPKGLSTPNRRAYSAPQETRTTSFIEIGNKTFSSVSSSTPMADKRKLRKRKLFDTDEYSTGTDSSPDTDEESSSFERLNDSILRVAEMELKRLKSNEEIKPKACTKLVTRYNSDTIIPNSNNQEAKKLKTAHIPSIIAKRKNLVVKPLNNPSYSCNMMKVKTPSTQTAFNKSCVSTSKSTGINDSIQLKPTHQKVIKLLPIGNVRSLKTISPGCIISGNSVNDNSGNISQIARYKLETTAKTTKIINLTNFDGKKLIPIKKSDFKISHDYRDSRVSLGSTKLIENKNISNKGIMMTKIQTPIIQCSPLVSPGDTFKAIQVGNTLQLVPIKSKNLGNNSNYGDSNSEDST